jgi:predicted MFS family arabinose efflux permease
MRLTDRSLVVAMCFGQVGNLLPHVAVPSVMPQHLMPLWSLSGSEAGMMASAFAFGYMLAVPVLTTLTDRIDARGILLVGSTVSALATLAFGVWADGLWSATAIWFVAGVGFAGAYMPGLKALTDRLSPGDVSRSITLYTSSFSFGVGISFLVSQLVAEYLGWRAAFLITGIGPIVMIAVCIAMPAVHPVPSTRKLLDFGPVLRNRPAMGYVLGYGAHCFELYGIRTWIVAFWAFVAMQNNGAVPLGPVAVSVIFALLSMPASILGNEAALRFGRHRALTVLMIASAAVAVAIGMSVQGAPLLLLVLLLAYGLTVPADSGALTSGMAMSASASHKGATMAMHSTVGFGLSAVGAWAAGITLDLAGGPASASGWVAVFALLAASILLGPLALWWSRYQGSDGRGSGIAKQGSERPDT